MEIDVKSEAYMQMVQRSFICKGNPYRVKKAIEKAKNGEEVTIAYLGGSITQGVGSDPIHTECYAYKSYRYFKEAFGKNGGNNVKYVKAGVSGTPSELGMIRYQRDVLRYGTVKPDIVFVEFAVNDADDETKGDCFESLVRNILKADNDPAVILAFSVFESDWNLQDRLAPVGKHYQLPMLSVKDAVVGQFYLTPEQGRIITKEQYFADQYHPTNMGHAIMADCINNLIRIIESADDVNNDITIPDIEYIGKSFEGVKLLDRKDNTNVARIQPGSFTETDTDLHKVEMDMQTDGMGTDQFPYNWKAMSSENAPFTMVISSKNLVLVYKDSGDAKFGEADVYVDGRFFGTADPLKEGWNHCHVMLLYNEKTAKNHVIEIKRKEGGKQFTILGFGYTP